MISLAYLMNIFHVLAIPLFFFATYREVKKRVFTNVFLTMTRLGQKRHLANIRSIVLANLSRIIADRLRFLSLLLPFWLLKRLILRLASPVGLHKLDAALARGHGAVVFSCHIGPYYLTPAVLALLGYRVVIVERLGLVATPILNYQIKRLNSSQGETVLEMTTVYDDLLLRKLKKHLQQGKVVFIMADYHGLSSREAEYVKFLGYDIVPGRGIAWLHNQTGAPLIPIVTQYHNGDKPRLDILDELTTDRSQDVHCLTQDVYYTIEQRILQSPERWALWMDYHLMLSPEVKG
jgi:lauroyl/myristoyl acyltransferase